MAVETVDVSELDEHSKLTFRPPLSSVLPSDAANIFFITGKLSLGAALQLVSPPTSVPLCDLLAVSGLLWLRQASTDASRSWTLSLCAPVVTLPVCNGLSRSQTRGTSG